MNNEIHPKLKNLIMSETAKERIEAKKTKVSAKKVAIRRAIEDHQEARRVSDEY